MSVGPSNYPALWDRFTKAQGRVHLTGLQALLRVALDQIRADRLAGRRVGGMISGYPGSPLAGFDQLLNGLEPLLREHDVRFVPGLNEELAASTVGGSQWVDLFPHSKYDGAIGMWFGKAPGLDRALDSMRHANFVGTSRFGGALAVIGDDPSSKSSTLPSHSEYAAAHAMIPLLVPADAADVVELGRHAYALSRYAGLWTGMKIVADVADGGVVFDCGSFPAPELPKFDIRGHNFEKRLDPRLLTPHVNRIEEEIFFERLEAVQRYACANRLDRVTHRHSRDRIGLVASGRLYRVLEGALARLGLDSGALEELGVRVMNLRMVYPLDQRSLRDFAEGLSELIVIDERRGFLESQIRSVLYDGMDHPLVHGQRRDSGEPWLARHFEINAETVAMDLGAHLASRLSRREFHDRVERIRAFESQGEAATKIQRPPVFCGGCPHNASTRLPEGARAGGGIGCHTIALLGDRGIQFVGAMGAEGTPWIGLAPYVDTPHLFQNLGDGTYFHSGRLAVRACVEAGARVTFKILYNGVIAMTGGQDAVGVKPVAELVRDIRADGVRRVIAMSSDPDLRALARRDPAVRCIDRDEYDQAMVEIAREPGVTALVYDSACANQKQRLERRGLRLGSGEQVLIHEDVCEGCGDCGKRSSCVSLRPVSTTLGRKTRVHESSCADDRTCVKGDCPAFLSVAGRGPFSLPAVTWDPQPLPDPPPAVWRTDRYAVLLAGVGSTGIVSTDALLMRAAEHEGLFAIHLDQTGLAQRGGRVASHCVFSRAPVTGSPRVGWGEADALFALDSLTASDADSLRRLDPQHTRAVINSSLYPTAGMIEHPEQALPNPEELVGRIRSSVVEATVTQAESLAEAVMGESMFANTILLGAALQRGLLPLAVASVESAIRDRGVQVEGNLRALALGRSVVVDASLADRLLADAKPPAVGSDTSAADAKAVFGAAWTRLESSRVDARVLDRIAGFAVDLCDYQNESYGRRYLATLTEFAAAESRTQPGNFNLTDTAARELYRLMAYKDEYEVARLLLRGPYRRWLERRLGHAPALRYHLHPPLLRALGMKRKLRLDTKMEPLLRTLVSLRRLRGTAFDPFGRSSVRRLERELVEWYVALLGQAGDRLSSQNLERAKEIVSAPERIRGYEDIKESAAVRVRGRADTLLAAFIAARPQ